MGIKTKLFGTGLVLGCIVVLVISLFTPKVEVEDVRGSQNLYLPQDIEPSIAAPIKPFDEEVLTEEETTEPIPEIVPQINFPFETVDLGEMEIIPHQKKTNKNGSRNWAGMTVTINPNIVPYGTIIYIDGLGFRYNQPGDVTDENAICVYFAQDEDIEQYRNLVLNTWVVKNEAHIDILSGDIKAENNGTFHLTAYCPCTRCCDQYGGSPEGKLGAIGTYVYEGTTVASDKNVLPYGTVVYIEGVGIRFVTDCGGAINHKEIDVYYRSHSEANEFGNQYHNVWILQ
jgi:3D (Asp-Asp-Asp) domain-containing protein